jgi:hypothetical protein
MLAVEVVCPGHADVANGPLAAPSVIHINRLVGCVNASDERLWSVQDGGPDGLTLNLTIPHHWGLALIKCQKTTGAIIAHSDEVALAHLIHAT